MVWWTIFDTNIRNMDYDRKLEHHNVDIIKLDLLCDQNRMIKGRETILRRTPIIASLGQTTKTVVDIRNLLECGMNIAKIQGTFMTIPEATQLLDYLKQAITQCCTKYNSDHWPLATALELRSWRITTGVLKPEYPDKEVYLEVNSEVVLSCDREKYSQCSESYIYVDYPYLMKDLKVGMRVAIIPEACELECEEIVDMEYAKCRVIVPGIFKNNTLITVRGMNRSAPPVHPDDDVWIKYANENKIDIVIVPYLRSAESARAVRRQLSKEVKIFGGICTQYGLDNFDSIVTEVDAIVIHSEYLQYELSSENANKIAIILKLIGGKCMCAGKPFFITGNIMKDLATRRIVSVNDLSDITNLILYGVTGIFVKEIAQDINLTLQAIYLISRVCKIVEPFINVDTPFTKLDEKLILPCNAAEAAVLSASKMARMSCAAAIIIITASGKTVRMMAAHRPSCIIMAVTSNLAVARGLHIYRGVIPLVYSEEPKLEWMNEMLLQLKYAADFAVRRTFMRTGEPIVALMRQRETSAYCDLVEVIDVKSVEHELWKCD